MMKRNWRLKDSGVVEACLRDMWATTGIPLRKAAGRQAGILSTCLDLAISTDIHWDRFSSSLFLRPFSTDRVDTSKNQKVIATHEQEDKNLPSVNSGHVISIDRSGLIIPSAVVSSLKDEEKACTVTREANERGDSVPVEKEKENELTKHLKSLIQFRGGPLTVAEYMTEALTHPTAGYYTNRTIFGSKGDFITSPEISQMFGEMIGIWCVALWQQLGLPKKLRLVELGPGKGTLMKDLLRGIAPFKDFHNSLSIDFVEISTNLREVQWENLSCEGNMQAWEGICGGTTPIKWHASLDNIPNDMPTLYIGHEFMDALPVHHFVRGKDGNWCEALVDINEDVSDSRHFRLALAPYDTFASRTILPSRLRELDQEVVSRLKGIEVSPACMAIASTLAERISKTTGAALIIDYGQDGPFETSVVAIKDHDFVDFLEQPGLVDISAYVDFSALRSSVGTKAQVHGPMDQSYLLKSLGIDARLEFLLSICKTEEQKDMLLSGYKRLIGTSRDSQQDAQDAPPGMGDRYKAMCISNIPGSDPPIPFQ